MDTLRPCVHISFVRLSILLATGGRSPRAPECVRPTERRAADLRGRARSTLDRAARHARRIRSSSSTRAAPSISPRSRRGSSCTFGRQPLSALRQRRAGVLGTAAVGRHALALRDGRSRAAAARRRERDRRARLELGPAHPVAQHSIAPASCFRATAERGGGRTRGPAGSCSRDSAYARCASTYGDVRGTTPRRRASASTARAIRGVGSGATSTTARGTRCPQRRRAAPAASRRSSATCICTPMPRDAAAMAMSAAGSSSRATSRRWRRRRSASRACAARPASTATDAFSAAPAISSFRANSQRHARCSTRRTRRTRIRCWRRAAARAARSRSPTPKRCSTRRDGRETATTSRDARSAACTTCSGRTAARTVASRRCTGARSATCSSTSRRRAEPLRVHDVARDLHRVSVRRARPLLERSRLARPTCGAMNWNGARIGAFETYMDTPYYEQLQYVGDTRIQALISLYVAGDDRLMRQAIEHFDESRIPEGITASRYPSELTQLIPPFSLIYVAMVHDYYMHRDDPAFVRQRLAGIRGILDWYGRHVDATGMLGPMPYWNYVDWAERWQRGVPAGARRRPLGDDQPALRLRARPRRRARGRASACAALGGRVSRARGLAATRRARARMGRRAGSCSATLPTRRRSASRRTCSPSSPTRCRPRSSAR